MPLSERLGTLTCRIRNICVQHTAFIDVHLLNEPVDNLFSFAEVTTLYEIHLWDLWCTNYHQEPECLAAKARFQDEMGVGRLKP